MMYDVIVTKFGYSHLAGNGSLGEQVTVKAVILELVKLLGTQQGRNGFTEVSDCHFSLRIKSKINNISDIDS